MSWFASTSRNCGTEIGWFAQDENSREFKAQCPLCTIIQRTNKWLAGLHKVKLNVDQDECLQCTTEQCTLLRCKAEIGWFAQHRMLGISLRGAQPEAFTNIIPVPTNLAKPVFVSLKSQPEPFKIIPVSSYCPRAKSVYCLTSSKVWNYNNNKVVDTHFTYYKSAYFFHFPKKSMKTHMCVCISTSSSHGIPFHFAVWVLASPPLAWNMSQIFC